MRLGAHNVSVNHKRGVYHYIAHAAGSDAGARTCAFLSVWNCVMFKPYPKSETDRPRFHMEAAWESGDMTPPIQSLPAA